MEKYHLPIMRDNPFEPRVESKEKELPVELKIAKAFLHQKYPLSEKGEKLRESVAKIVQGLKRNPSDNALLEELHGLKSSLPTVEDPNLDLFADFEITDDEGSPLFGPDLANVQVTKGCRHRCEHCAAGAEEKVKVMPFAAVLRITQRIKRVAKIGKELRGEVANDCLSLGRDPEFAPIGDRIRRLANEGIAQAPGDTFSGALKKSFLGRLALFEWSVADLRSIYESYRLDSDMEPIDGKLKEELDGLFSALDKRLPFRELKKLFGNADTGALLKQADQNPGRQRITNYYDSDPFDYRDTTFLHKDGTPADYGDVAMGFADAGVAVEITTAGWPVDDKVAQRAAEKIAAMPRDSLHNPRVSVHPYEIGTTKGDPATYRRDMENVMATLAPIQPEAVFLNPKSSSRQGAYAEVLSYLHQVAKKSGFKVFTSPEKAYLVSKFSGRLAPESGNDSSHPDIMACLPGYHIWPDGSLHEQLAEKGFVEQGSRPQALGKSLYRLKNKS